MAILCRAVLLLFFSVAAHGEEPWLLAKYDRDGDQKITQQEVVAHKQSLFEKLDDNANGDIEFSEYEQADQARRKALLKARFAKLDRTTMVRSAQTNTLPTWGYSTASTAMVMAL